MKTETEKPKLIVRLDNVRLSFPNLFDARAPKGSDKAKFSADFILNKKTQKDQIAKLEKLCERAMLDKFGKKVGIKHMCLKDGNDPSKQDIEGYGDEVMYLTAKNDSRPAIVDQKKVTITKEDGKIYGGCYVNASVEIYGFKHDVGGNCILASLRAVQFVRDGESLGGNTPVDVDEEFEEVSEDVGSY